MQCLARLALIALLISADGVSAAEGPPEPPFNGLSRANGKQLVRTSDRWIVVTPDPTGRAPTISTAPLNASAGKLEGWTSRPFFSTKPDAPAGLRSLGPARVPPSMVADRQGRLHVAWDDGQRVWYSRLDASGNPADALKLTPQPVASNMAIGDIAVDDQGRVWIVGAVRDRSGVATCIGDGKSWEINSVAAGTGFHPPVMHLTGDGTAHLAWSDTRGRVLYQQHRPGKSSRVEVLCAGGYHPNGRSPAIIARGEQVLVVYETLYHQIEYALLEDGRWKTVQRLTSSDERFAPDVLHSPQLALDRHGVVWLFFSDSTRRYTYFARWLGGQWSDIYDCRGIYYRSPRFESDLLPADWLAVEKYPPAEATDIGLSLANSLAPEKNEFHAIDVPGLKAAAGSSTLFLDLLETAQMQNLELHVQQAEKNPNNPLVKPGPPGSFDQDRVLNHGTVLFDEGKFRMWYGAAHRQPGVYWFRWMSTGYAESADGLHWEKPCLTGSAAPSPDCNRQPLPWPCAVFKDPQPARPDERYKCVQFDRHQLQLMLALNGEYDMDSPINPGRLYQSADGLHWTNEPVTLRYRDGKPAELVVQSFFIDPSEADPARRWKAYGYASLVQKRRAGCFAYSADGRKWTAYPRNPILDPTVSEVPLAPSGPIAQIHDTVVFPYRGYYLALFHAQHDATFLDVELAASRDGEHFMHVKHGQKVLALGKPGSWDSQQILQTAPVAAHDKLWLFYGGQHMPPELEAKGEKNTELLQGGAGLATLRMDGFSYLTVRDGQTSGSVTTIPFEPGGEEPVALVINARCAKESPISVNVVEADTKRVIKLASLKSDRLRHVVPLGHAKRLEVGFGLRSSGDSAAPRLYGFGFERQSE